MCLHGQGNARIRERIQSWAWSLRSPQSRGAKLDTNTLVRHGRGWAKWKNKHWGNLD